VNKDLLGLNMKKNYKAETQSGLSMVELMVSLTLGLLVLLVATTLLFTTRASFSLQTDHSDIQESASFAIDNIARSLRQAGYVNLDSSSSPQITAATSSADIVGLDASTLSATNSDIAGAVQSKTNFSDVLAIRFFGAGNSISGDGTVTNCAGFPIPAPISSDTADEDRGWSIYYVVENANKEPELFCKYQSINSKNGNMSWSAQAIIKGVESFQVLYGIDISRSDLGGVKKFLTASEINALDLGLDLVGDTATERKIDLNRKTFWKKVTEVRVAMLVSGEERTRNDSLVNTYHLFGDDYAAIAGNVDKGTTIKESDIPTERRNRLRRVYITTVLLRNNCIVDLVRGICSAPA